MNFRRNAQEQNAGFQMAPMLDVVFLLLMFMLVSTIYAQWERKTKLSVPTAEDGVQEPRSVGELIINVDSDGHYFINTIEMSASRLRDILAQSAEQFKGHPVIIRADRKTDFQAVVTVLDICRAVDIWNVSFATIPPEDAVPAATP